MSAQKLLQQHFGKGRTPAAGPLPWRGLKAVNFTVLPIEPAEIIPFAQRGP